MREILPDLIVLSALESEDRLIYLSEELLQAESRPQAIIESANIETESVRLLRSGGLPTLALVAPLIKVKGPSVLLEGRLLKESVCLGTPTHFSCKY